MNTQTQHPELIIDENGRIEDINDPSSRLLGSESDRAKSRHISMIIPILSKLPLLRKDQINPRLKFLARIGQQFEVKKIGGGCVLCKLLLNGIEHSGKRLIRITMFPGDSGSARSHPINSDR